MGKDSKHKKKSSHKKKHKYKKKHKEKKPKKRSKSSSESDTSSDSSNFEDDGSKTHGGTKCFPEKVSGAIQDEFGWDDLFSEKNTTMKKKNEIKKEGHILEKPGQSARELNPYWKDGGNGLPPMKEESAFKKALEKSSQIEDSDKNRGKSIQHFSNVPPSRYKDVTESTGGRLNFMKPGEGSHLDFRRSYQQNWRKKEEKVCREVDPVEGDSKSLNVSEETVSSVQKSSLTADDLNALAAKKIKAEIMGNKALAEKLEREIESAKKEMQTHSGSKTEYKKEEIVLVRKNINETDSKQYENENSRKRRRGETHRGNERLRYFMDDDKHSLKSMFESEKLGTAGHSDELFMKLAKKGKLGSSNDDNDLDDAFLDHVRTSKFEKSEYDKERSRSMNEAKTRHKSLTNCRWCLDGNNMQKHLIISVGRKCYLCLPRDKSLTNGHCLIVPSDHETCGTQLDEDTWNEVTSYRNRLCRMFEDSGRDIVFFENARGFNRFPHMVLHCVPIDKEVGSCAPIYFKKAIMESETEWSNNKKLIDLRKKDLRRSVPKGLPYFAVDFGRDGGFAHVIEDERLFPYNFAEEIIGGMLDMDAVDWRKPRRESFESQKEKAEEFLRRWKKYEDPDFREKIKPNSDSSDSD